jgi:glutamate-1-semialdehyde 2,1-aminomutase
VDLMCSYGPIVLGHQHPAVDAAAAAQQARGDCQNGPAPVMVDLAERLVERVAHADWALFAKNGTDATTACMTIARATTDRRRILVAEGAYHGAAPWCTPSPAGVVDSDRAHLGHYTFNDLASVHEAVARAGADDLAGIVVSPFRHDARYEQELVDPAFARGLRALCDETGAALIIDEVRAGFRLAPGGSWEPLDVAPDLSAWSKAIANGYPLAAVLGNRQFERGARRAYLTGSFWFAAAAMAAGVATLDALETTDALGTMVRCGQRLRDGLTDQAAAHGIAIAQTGPVQMPLLTFTGDEDFAMANVWAGATVAAGAYVHPWHNWFLSGAHTDALIDRALEATDQGFAAVASQFGAGSAAAPSLIA